MNKMLTEALGVTAQEQVVVAWDIDGVRYNLIDTLRYWCHTRWGFSYARMIDPPTYSIEDAWGISRADLTRALVGGVKDGIVFRHGRTYPAACDAHRKVRAAGHQSVMVTARNLPGVEDLCRAATDAWLTDEGIDHDGLFLTDDKNSVGWDVLFDDYEVNVAAALADDRRAYLIDQPWNDGVTHLPKVRFEDIPAVVEQIAEQKAALREQSLAATPAA